MFGNKPKILGKDLPNNSERLLNDLLRVLIGRIESMKSVDAFQSSSKSAMIKAIVAVMIIRNHSLLIKDVTLLKSVFIDIVVFIPMLIANDIPNNYLLDNQVFTYCKLRETIPII